MKRAIAKCTKTEMPELDLPMFSSPYRAVQALLNGARDMESVNVARFQNLMKNVQSGNVPGAAQSSYIPIPVPVKQQQQTADPVDEIMRKLFLRKIIDKFSEKDRDDEDDDEVPDLVENFDEVSKNETATEDAKISEVSKNETATE